MWKTQTLFRLQRRLNQTIGYEILWFKKRFWFETGFAKYTTKHEHSILQAFDPFVEKSVNKVTFIRDNAISNININHFVVSCLRAILYILVKYYTMRFCTQVDKRQF